MTQHNTVKIIEKIFDIVSNEYDCYDQKILHSILKKVEIKMKKMLPFSIEYIYKWTHKDIRGSYPQSIKRILSKRFNGPGPAITYLQKNIKNFLIESEEYPYDNFRILYRNTPVDVIHFEWGETLWKNSKHPGIYFVKLDEFHERYKKNVNIFLWILNWVYGVTPKLYKDQLNEDLEQTAKTELNLTNKCTGRANDARQ